MKLTVAGKQFAQTFASKGQFVYISARHSAIIRLSSLAVRSIIIIKTMYTMYIKT